VRKSDERPEVIKIDDVFSFMFKTKGQVQIICEYKAAPAKVT
jgi:hypothetical protein